MRPGIEAVNSQLSGFVYPRICALLYVRLASLLCDTRVGPNSCLAMLWPPLRMRFLYATLCLNTALHAEEQYA